MSRDNPNLLPLYRQPLIPEERQRNAQRFQEYLHAELRAAQDRERKASYISFFFLGWTVAVLLGAILDAIVL